jgi:hypothetical protein
VVVDSGTGVRAVVDSGAGVRVVADFWLAPQALSAEPSAAKMTSARLLRATSDTPGGSGGSERRVAI